MDGGWEGNKDVPVPGSNRRTRSEMCTLSSLVFVLLPLVLPLFSRDPLSYMCPYDTRTKVTFGTEYSYIHDVPYCTRLAISDIWQRIGFQASRAILVPIGIESPLNYYQWIGLMTGTGVNRSWFSEQNINTTYIYTVIYVQIGLKQAAPPLCFVSLWDFTRVVPQPFLPQ